MLNCCQLVGAVVRKLARPIVVVHEEGEACSRAGRGPLQHLQVAVRVAKGGNGPPANAALDADRLTFLVVHQVDSASLTSTGRPSRISNFSLPPLPTTCSGGMP